MALAVLGISGCGGGGESRKAAGPEAAPAAAGRSQARKPPTDREQIEALLARRARALSRGDASAYAATAIGAQRARDRRAARRTQGLGVIRARFVLSEISVGPRRAVGRGRSTYALSGLSGRYSARRRVVAVESNGAWRIAAETSRRERHPWEVGRFTRTRSAHFVVLAPSQSALEDLTGTLEAGYDTLSRALPTGRLRRRYLAVVARSAAQARKLTRDIRGIDRLAAITDSEVVESGRARRATRVISQRVVIVWPVLKTLDPASRVRIVAHELTHASLAGATSGRTPSWLVEGVALYASGDRRVDEAALELSAPNPPKLADFDQPDAIARLSGARQRKSYALASAAAHYLAERFGRAGLLRLYASFNDDAVKGRPGEARTVDRALRTSLGLSLRRFERDLRRWVQAS